MGKIKLYVVDDHKIVRQGIISMISENPDYVVLGEANNGHEFLETIKNAPELPDIVLMDITMPVMDGISCTMELSRNFPAIKVITLTMVKQNAHIKKMLQAGAVGYILKSGDKMELFRAIDSVYAGTSYFSPSVSNEVMMNMMRIKKKPTGLVTLSSREKEVLELIARDYGNKEIADKLSISIRTVESHKQNLIAKTNTKSVAGLIVYAVRNNLINLDQDPNITES